MRGMTLPAHLFQICITTTALNFPRTTHRAEVVAPAKNPSAACSGTGYGLSRDSRLSGSTSRRLLAVQNLGGRGASTLSGRLCTIACCRASLPSLFSSLPASLCTRHLCLYHKRLALTFTTTHCTAGPAGAARLCTHSLARAETGVIGLSSASSSDGKTLRICTSHALTTSPAAIGAATGFFTVPSSVCFAAGRLPTAASTELARNFDVRGNFGIPLGCRWFDGDFDGRGKSVISVSSGGSACFASPVTSLRCCAIPRQLLNRASFSATSRAIITGAFSLNNTSEGRPQFASAPFARSSSSPSNRKMAPARNAEDAVGLHERPSKDETSRDAASPTHHAVAVAKRQRPTRALEMQDKELYDLVTMEKKRQVENLELIASENFTSQAVMECLGSCLTNKYSEGYPGARYYGGNEIIDKIELLCQQRALKAFGLNADEWAVNVQPYSGSPANLAVYVGLLQPHDRLMGLDLPAGGHLTHGFYTPKKRISASSIFFESLPYGVNQETGLIDYDELRKHALLFRPKLIICGHSAYPRDLKYTEFRAIADAVGAVLMCDMAHTSGLIAAGLLTSPFEYCDVVTSTTHKTLRGPRSAMIFVNKKRLHDAEERINNAVFPTLQGGPHDNNIAALACQLREVATSAWREYAKQVIQNSQALAKRLAELGHCVVTGGTDNHLLVVDLRPDGITGAKMQLCCEEAYISVNKNAVPGDHAAANPSGLRVGSPAMTSRGMKEEHFEQIAAWLHEVIIVAREIQESHGKKIVDFRKGVQDNPRLKEIREQVVEYTRKFPMPGWEDI